MSRYINADIAVREATQEGAYGYISAEEIDKIPTADVRENVRGIWTDGFCSNCHQEAITEWNETGGEYVLTNFCPYCGAKMGEVKDVQNKTS